VEPAEHLRRAELLGHRIDHVSVDPPPGEPPRGSAGATVAQLPVAGWPVPRPKLLQAKPDATGELQRPGWVQRDCGCGGGCGCGGPVVAEEKVSGPPVRRIQRAPCGNDRREWYTGTRGNAAGRLAGGTGMDISNDLAHIVCCAFCHASIASVVRGGDDAGGGFARYTALFEPLVHRYHAQTNVPAGEARNVYTEEAYWVPANAAPFTAAAGWGGGADAHVIDQAFVAAVQPVLAAAFNTPLGTYPAGMPVAQQAGFDVYRNTIPGGAPAAVPVGGPRRSYPGAAIRHQPAYAALRWLSLAPAGGAATAWGNLKRLSGRMRILDFAGDRTAAGVGAAPQHTVADAKFFYTGGGHDDWGPGQAADQQAIYQEISGGGPGNAVPRVTWDVCACSELLADQLIFEKRVEDEGKATGKRRERDLKDSAWKRAQQSRKAVKFPNTATQKWVKQ